MLTADAASERWDLEAAADLARDQNGRAFVACIADTILPEAYRRLVQTGAGDWFTWAHGDEELRGVVARLKAGGGSDPGARVVSFLPSKGGVGNTTLLIETASALAKRRRQSDRRLAILDLNLQGGTVADALDLEARFDVSEVAQRPERLDEQLIDIFASRHGSGFDVFAGPFSRIPFDSVPPDTIFTLVDALAGRYDTLLLDLPSATLPWSDNLLRGSDAVVASGGETVPALRRLQATLAHLDTVGIARAKVAAAVTAVESDVLGRIKRRSIIERALAGHRYFTVRRDDGRLAEAMDVGRPLLELAPGTKIGRDLRRLADWIDLAADGGRAGAKATGVE